MKLRNKISLLASLITAWLLSINSASAQIINPALSDKYGKPPLGDGPFSGAFTRIFIEFWNVAIIVGTLIALVFLIAGAIEWITAGGESSKIEKARNKITQAIVGLIILVFLFAIISIINEVVFDGVYDILKLKLPDPNIVPTP